MADELWLDGARVAEVRYGAARLLRTHTHDVATLCVLLDGGATERRGAALVEQRPLDLLTRAALERHENQYHARGARALIVELDPSMCAVREAFARPAPAPPDLAVRLVGAFRDRGASREANVKRALRDVLEALRARARARTPPWLEASREVLVERLVDPPSLEELGCIAGVHPVHFAQSFRARWGMTPRGFVRAHRVFRAIELIEGGTSLAEAAARVGFADQAHMTRAISRAREAPPGALRRRMRALTEPCDAVRRATCTPRSPSRLTEGRKRFSTGP